MSKYNNGINRKQSIMRDWLYFYSAFTQADEEKCDIWPFRKSKENYGLITLNGKTSFIHAISCEYAHGNRPLGFYACHGPCHNTLCFNPFHLKWQSPSKNTADRDRDGTVIRGEDSAVSKLTGDAITKIRKAYATGDFSQQEIADECGVSQVLISKIVRKTIWTHIQ